MYSNMFNFANNVVMSVNGSFNVMLIQNILTNLLLILVKNSHSHSDLDEDLECLDVYLKLQCLSI